MLTKRIIPCLDIKDGRTVKGTKFLQLRDAGDPIELALRYNDQGADELVFLDITATIDNRKTFYHLVREVAGELSIPFTVGGGISEVDDVYQLLQHGADKISVNSAAVTTPPLIDELAKRFGSQCIVVAIDARPINGSYRVVTRGGRSDSDRTVVDWSREVADRGAGEILLTSMVTDGTKSGFDCDITQQVATLVPIPVIASGGAGKKEDFAEVFVRGQADAALAASLFHFNELTLPDLKTYLSQQKIPVRQ